ncbi:MAG: PAS domain-containing protein [Burkholderiales bacterium]|nr:PAS domain-containing protein [Burkholderiales bacterium]MDE2277831.1 PAS domain-containing protein [Burkholderiales bacterium]
MPQQDLTTAREVDLRRRAALRVTGPGGAERAGARATDALAVLHALATSPATADDALALLHELQVHQVELDLQAQELRESRVELETALRRQIELYDAQPVACFTVDRHLVIRELNRAAAALLGLERNQACGLALDTCLGVGGARDLQALVAQVLGGESPAASTLPWQPAGGASRRFRIDIGADPAGAHCFVVLGRLDDTPAQPPPAAPR